MNFVSATVGSTIILIGGIGVESLLFSFYVLFDIGTFHWTHFVAAYIFAIIVNTLIESGITKLFTRDLKYREIFKCLFWANAVSIMIAAVYVRVANVRIH